MERSPLADEIIVSIPNGQILGRERLSEDNQVFYAFQEIPYASPPVGELRFKSNKKKKKRKKFRICGNRFQGEEESQQCNLLFSNYPYDLATSNPDISRTVGKSIENPVPAPSWDGLLDARVNTKKCYQQELQVATNITETEDCLYLNVYTPLARLGGGARPLWTPTQEMGPFSSWRNSGREGREKSEYNNNLNNRSLFSKNNRYKIGTSVISRGKEEICQKFPLKDGPKGDYRIGVGEEAADGGKTTTS
ncbi:hypothetical protein NQ317_018755 [Molorchus minor]|uniref:Carboxylesterase type B domain-containing protein n=1 Tax=Molorchus minor TaxID=1323400 RepID=A0ABQ9J1N0_9CUCU|nr:hypothetical protein NQ317_018755 [Molorchus minor]